MAKLASFDEQILQSICDVLGDTSAGLTGSEIGRLLARCDIEDPMPNGTKRYRLFEALSQRQHVDRCGNNVVAFIMAAMNPVRYMGGDADSFENRRAELNGVLAFAGIGLGEDGKLTSQPAVKTLSEARRRARRLREKLIARQVHADVLHFCQAELLEDNYFHAVFEATKSVADKIRKKSGFGSDGGRLVDDAFGGFSKGGLPVVAFNSLSTETEMSEHKGLMNLLKGLFGTFRNTAAHAPRIHWEIKEQDALDMFSLASLLHRRLDDAVRISKTGSNEK